jgi:hypothetical protein
MKGGPSRVLIHRRIQFVPLRFTSGAITPGCYRREWPGAVRQLSGATGK